MLAGAYASYRFKGIKGLVTLIFNSIIPKGLVLLLVALLSPFLLAILAVVIHYFQTGIFSDLSVLGLSKEFPNSGIVTIFFYNLLFFGFGEEIGWRGVALPLLQSRYSALLSSFMLAGLWALWHWPLFLYRPGYINMDLVNSVGWLVSLLTGSVVLTWLFNSSRGNIIVCVIFHSAMDVAFTVDFMDSGIVNLIGLLVVICGIACILLCKPKNLSGQPKVTFLDN